MDTMSNKVYEIVTERIIQELEAGNVPWRKPWSAAWAPKNGFSRHDYRGINYALLSCEVDRHECPYFATKKQIYQAGGKIKDGAWKHSSLVTFWKLFGITKTDDKTGEEKPTGKRFPFLRYYRVWNLRQTEGIPWAVAEETPVDPIAECESITESYGDGPTISHDGGNEATYLSALDRVSMPIRHAFTSSEAYYGTLFHELIHSTGHKSRLNREMSGGKYSKAYAREELTAEMGSALLLGAAGILENPLVENSAAYLRGWIENLKNDPRCLAVACGKAQKAADWIRGKREAIEPQEQIAA